MVVQPIAAAAAVGLQFELCHALLVASSDDELVAYNYIQNTIWIASSYIYQTINKQYMEQQQQHQSCYSIFIALARRPRSSSSSSSSHWNV